MALEPKTGAVLALYSAPSFDPNRFIGGIPSDYWKQLHDDPRQPLYNKATQGTYPPGSTFKLATAVLALEQGLVTMDSRMPAPCTGGYYFGSRYFRCWDHSGHGSLTLAQAIAKSCDVYFYQLGLKLTIANFLAGGVGAPLRRPQRHRPAQRVAPGVAGEHGTTSTRSTGPRDGRTPRRSTWRSGRVKTRRRS